LPIQCWRKKNLKTLTVTGRGVETIPTTDECAFGVEVQGKPRYAAVGGTKVISCSGNAAIAQCRKETTGLNPVYSYNNNVQRLTGYSATNIVRFRLDTKRVGTLLDEAVLAELRGLISFVASDNAIAAAQQQALRKPLRTPNSKPMPC